MYWQHEAACSANSSRTVRCGNDMIAPERLADDHAVPGLAMAMDRQALMALLAEHLPDCRDGMQLLDARVADVQYTPGTAAQVLWKLTVRDPQSGRTARQLLCVKALRRDEPVPSTPVDLVDRYTVLRARRGMTRQIPIATPWLFVRTAHVLMHAFPLDPMLPRLIDVVDPRTMQEALHRAWRAHRDVQAEARHVRQGRREGRLRRSGRQRARRLAEPQGPPLARSRQRPSP